MKPGDIKVRKIDGKGYCVVGTDGSPLHGGKGSCHTNRADAVKQLRDIYATAGKNFSELDTIVGIKDFADLLTAAGTGEPVWIQAFPFGHWPHPQYTDTTITHERGERIVKNFKENVRRQEIATDYEHGMDTAKGSKASGWVKDAELREDGVYVSVDFTAPARQEIAGGEWKYFSASILDAWEDVETGEVFYDVLTGGGLTNKPWMKGRVPLNFSEVIPVGSLEKTPGDDDNSDSGLRFKKDVDGAFHVSEDGGKTWRTPATNEVTEWEHSEPGSGSPPTPRLDEDDKSGDKDGNGIRRDTPPPQDKVTKEGSDMKLSAEALKALGLADDASEEQVNAEIVKMYSELTPLKTAAAKAATEKSFAEQFPEQHAELEANRAARLTTEAKTFSEQFERIVVVDDEGKVTAKSTRGPSGLALQKMQETHKAFSEGKPEDGLKLFNETLSVILSDKGIVEYGESGSSREAKDTTGEIATDQRDAAKKFSELALAAQVEAGGKDKLSWGDAISQVAKANPELAKQYRGNSTVNG